MLGPIFFLIYLNSIFRLPFHGKIVAFADDMALSYSNNDKNDLIKNINYDLKLVSSWFSQHSMILSDKTKAMFFQISGFPSMGNVLKYHVDQCLESDCKYDCIEIDCVHEFKYLGIHLDSNLNWKTHIDTVSKFLNVLLRKKYFIRSLCPSHILKNFYYSLVQSKIEYGLVCWGGSYQYSLDKVLKLQKHIVKAMYFKPRSSSSWSLFCSHHLLPLRYLYVYKVLKMFFCRSGNSTFKNTTNYTFRSNFQFLYEVPRSKREHFRRFFLYMGPHMFNKLPLLIRRCAVRVEFLKHVKEWLFSITDLESLTKVLI